MTIVSLNEAVSHIRPGMTVAVPPDYCGIAMAATRALIRAGTDRLHVVAVPATGLQGDVMIGAGLVETMEAAAVTLGEAGPAPRFVDAMRRGTVRMMDATCPAIHAALQAAEKGLPFMPLRGILGSDLPAHRPDWRVIENPFGNDDPIVLLPAIRPDVALFHCEMADRHGNLWIGRRRELATMAHAARMTVATVEEIYEGDLFADETMAAGALPATYIEAIAHVPGGAWPMAMPGYYEADADEIIRYATAAATAEGFAAWLDGHLADARAA